MIKVGILSDTHGVIHPEIIKLMNDCDFVIHAGDIVDEDSLRVLRPKQKMIAVKGNNDLHISSLGEVEMLDLPGGNIAVEHGHMHGHIQPSHDSLRDTYPNAKIVVYGHTHKQVIDKEGLLGWSIQVQLERLGTMAQQNAYSSLLKIIMNGILSHKFLMMFSN